MIENYMLIVFAFFGLPGQSFGVMLLLTGAISTGCIIMGWLADLILEGISFGVLQNGLIMIAGAAISFWLWHRFGLTFKGQMGAISICAAGVGGGVALMSCAIIRKYI
jgi:hypothetical protein